MMSLSVASGFEDENKGRPPTKPSINLDLQSMKAVVTGMMAYIGSRVTIDTVRPLNMFLGITGPSFCFSTLAFNTPVKKVDKSTCEKFQSRLKLNFAFFLSNYALVTAGVALVTALMHPGMVISVIVLWGLWSLHKFLISNELLVFGRNIGTLLSISQRSSILMILTALVIILKCLKPTVTVLTISGSMIFTHALLRDPTHVTSGDFQNGNDGTSDDDSIGNSHESEVLVEKPGQV
mmetsp:Transcript_15930/g.36885  ORF Transcript_15930/g.36885 Transcript_15930/m.36885 type:complete len:236 (-) Transcript_15930:288-995(-)